MTPHMRYGIIGVIIGLILLFIYPVAGGILIALAIAVPVIAYRMLTPEQRRRLRRAGRKQIGS
jgi:uncharacterized membrane protein HdeD (DUF308 family)